MTKHLQMERYEVLEALTNTGLVNSAANLDR